MKSGVRGRAAALFTKVSDAAVGLDAAADSGTIAVTPIQARAWDT